MLSVDAKTFYEKMQNLASPKINQKKAARGFYVLCFFIFVFTLCAFKFRRFFYFYFLVKNK